MTPRHLIAPLGLLALAAGGVWCALPEGLPFWRSLAIVTAWAGSGLLVGSLVLMVREPHLAAFLGGLDVSYRWHHRSGTIAYALLLVHPLALAMAGWEESPAIAWQSLSPWSRSWPVWLGWAALILLMAGLGATFSRRLSYRRWRAFHYLLGLGVILGLVHVHVLLGGASQLLALAVLATLALAWRLVAADLGAAAHPYRVATVASRAARMIEARLVPCGARLDLSPGQFVLAAFGDGPRFQGCREFHPFTVSHIGPEGELAVSIKALGPCTAHIQALEPGVTVRLQGPFGTFLKDGAAAPQLWVAGGIGITPFMAALRAGPLPQPTTLVYLYRSEHDAAFVAELTARAAEDPRFELLAEACGEGIPDLDEVLARVTGLAARQAQLCGPVPMVESVRRLLLARGLRPDAIHYESFDFR